MADLEKTVSIIFSGVDKTGAVFSGITKNIDQFSGKIQTVTQPLADVASGVLKTEGALAALAAGGLAYAYSKSIEFEGAVIDLQKVLGDEAGGMDEATEAALKLSNQYGVSATEVLQSTANFKQAGFDIQESIQLTKNSLDLKIAGDVSAAQSSEILIAALKGFDAPASDAARLIDVLNAVSNEYATDVEQLATGMAKLSPIANTMGFSFEETAGVLTPVIEVFRSGDEAATALKTGLLKLVDDSKPVKDALESIGVSQVDMNGNMRSGKDILADVSRAFQGLDQNQKLVVSSQLVGVEQAARMVLVFDNLNKSAEITQVGLQGAGSATSEVALRLASGVVAVERFKVGFENMAIAVGAKFQGAATNAIAGATDIENTLQELTASGAFDELLNVVSGMSDEMGDLFNGIAKAMPEALKNVDWSQFTGSLQGVVDEVGDLFGVMFGEVDLTTPEGLATAMQKVVDAGSALNNVVKGLLKAWEPFIRNLSEGIEKFSQGGPEVQEFVGKIVGLGQAFNVVAGLVGPLASSLTGLTNIFIGLAGVKAGKTLLGFAGNATTAAASIKGLPGALSSAIGTTAGKTGMLGLAAAAGWAAGTIINENVPAVGKAAQAVIGWSDKVLNWSGTQKDANQVINDNNAFLAAQAQAIARTTGAVTGLAEEISESDLEVNPTLSSLETRSFDESLSIVEAKMREFEKSGEPIEIVATNFEALETFQQTTNAWDVLSFDADGNVNVGTNFDDVQGEWDLINDSIGEAGGSSPEISFKTMYKWTDASGTPHVTDAPPDPGAAIGDVETIKMPIGAKVDKGSVAGAKRAIKTALNASVGDVNVKLNFGGNGMGGVGVGAAIGKEISEMEPIDLGEVVDMSGLSDLLDSIKGMENYADRREMANQALRIVKAQEGLMRAEERNINARNAILAKETANITRMEGGFDNAIKIEASGLEPEMEAFMYKLLKKIQVRANEAGAEFLLAAT